MSNEELHSLAVSMANGAGVDPDLVCAIVGVESSWQPLAARYEPLYRYLESTVTWAIRVGCEPEEEEIFQKMSWGLMQVMGGVARQYGFAKPLPMLCDAKLGLEIGIEHLKSKIKAYGPSESAIISSYNAGMPKIRSTGGFGNQGYVDAVSAKLKDLRIFKKGI